MAWTTPRTWTIAEFVTKAILDTHIRDNLNALAGITGIIPAAGATATAGTGFTYTHTNGTGVYVFTFSSAFAATPVILATVIASGSFGVQVTAAATTGFTVQTFNTNTGGSGDQPFHFKACVVV